MDFARALRTILAGQPEEQRPIGGRQDVVWMFPQSLNWALDHRDTRGIFQALKDAPFDDPALAAAAMRRALTHYLPPSLSRHGKQAI